MKASKKDRIKNYLLQRAGRKAGRLAALTALLLLAVMVVPFSILDTGADIEANSTGSHLNGIAHASTGPPHQYIWKKLGGPHGGIGYDIRMRPDNPDIMYVTDSWAGLHKSEDGGKTWFPANEGIDARTGPSGDAIPVFSVTVEPHNPDVLWSGLTGQRGVYKSTDGGETWSLKVNGIREQGITFRGFTVDPHNPDIVYAAGEISSGEWAGREQTGAMFDKTRGKVYRTSDGGESWTAIWSGDNLARYVWIDPRDPKRLFVNNYQGGNLVSTDGGESWVTASKGYSGAQVSGGIVVDPDNPARVYVGALSGMFRSNDGGETWEGLSFPPARFNQINAVAVSPDNFDLIIKSPWDMGGQLPRSEDGGRSWEVVEVAPGKIPTFVDIAFAPSEPQTVYAAVGRVQCKTDTFRCESETPGGGVYVSHDAGKSWQSATDAKIRDQSLLTLAMHPQNASIVYAGTTNSGVYRTTDGGRNWQPVNKGLRSHFVRSLAIDPVNHEVIYLGTGDSELYISRDGGESWTWSSAGMNPGETISAIVIDPVQPNVIYAGSIASGVYLSEDAGETWRQINNGLETRAILTLGISSDGGVVYAGTQGGGVFRLGEISPEDLAEAKASIAPKPPEQELPVPGPEPEPAREPPSVEPVPAEKPPEPEPEQTETPLPSEPESRPSATQPPPDSIEDESSFWPYYLGGAAVLICLVGLLLWFRRSRRRISG